MNGLLMHTAGSGVVTKDTAFTVPVPEATRTYTPVSNKALWELLQETADD